MTRTGRTIGIVLTLAMFVFSAWMYLRTSDWVALIFAIGSFGYAIVFLKVTPGSKP
ncbi:hypothetical protein H2508_03395 [Parahaliea sp. F7430]|uniref:Uncharacterized protein n=1 Tax=Sediminihaliea albiluteola TaxID=2758564 RepID=A0A7W2TUE7_9GAMM|nr:hypothetical protein [Sediminihaliea albiluteola]MBA6412149.1 hypothetical protein [Sediminihaliea albiluteola]